MADEKEIKRLLEEEAELRKRIAESSAEYLKILKDIKAMHKNIATVEKERAKKAKLILDLTNDYNAARNRGDQAEMDRLEEIIELEKIKHKILEDEVDTMNKSLIVMTKVAKETSKLGKSMAFLTQAKNDVVGITNAIKFGYGKMKNWAGLFDMDKSIRMATLNMGLLNKRGQVFRTNIKDAANSTIDFGVGIKELAQIHATYSDELGRSMFLGESGLKAIGDLSVATNLGAEASARMTSDFELQGMSAERTAKFVEDTMNDASRMGLNATKVIKNIQQNMKLLNRYNFRGGVKGLKAMAETATKLGIDMNSVAAMADKLFDIEGAIDMSSQLQVLGGAWSNLADPFHLMYLARNDMNGLTDEIAKAASQSAKFNSETKQFEVSALEMHRLRKVAEQTGMDYETLATAAKNAAKFTNIRKQIHYNFDKDTKEFIENTAQINENGEAYIKIDGHPKLLNQLNALDKQAIDASIREKKSLAQRAEASQTFDERLSNLIMQVKQLLLPVLEGIDKGLRPIVDKFSSALKDKKFRESMEKIGEVIGTAVGIVGKFMYEHPVWSVALFGMFELGKWYLNGKALGLGFNSVASVDGGGGILDGLTGGKSTAGRRGIIGAFGNNKLTKGLFGSKGMFGKFGSTKGGTGLIPSLGKGLRVGSLAGLLGIGSELGRGMMDDPNSTGGKMLGIGGSAASGAALGAMIGSVIPGLGTAVGGLIGGGAGLLKGLYDEYYSEDARQKPVTRLNDGIIFNDRDKFLKMNDGSMIAGTNVNGNKDLAKAIGGDKLSDTVKIEFGDIHFKFDELKITSPGHPGLSVDVLNDPVFIRNLTRMIHVETEKVIDGGKVKPK